MEIRKIQGQKVPKENASYKCLPLIMLDSVIRVYNMHYQQTLLEECKYEIKKYKMKNSINDDFDLISRCKVPDVNLTMNVIVSKKSLNVNHT